MSDGANDITRWLRVGAAAADLKALAPDLVILAALAKDATRLATALAERNVPGDLSTPDRLLPAVVQAIDRPEVGQAFAALGLDDLFQSVRQRTSRLGASDQPWSRLLLPASAFAERYDGKDDERFGDYDEGSGTDVATLAIPPLAGKVGLSPARIGLKASASGTAALHCEAGALWPFPKDEVKPGLLRLGVTGAATAGAAATAPFGTLGTGGASARTSVDVAASLFFRPASPDTSVAAALLQAIPALADPFDLAAVRRSMAMASLEGVVLRFAGSAGAGVEAAIGRNFDVPGLLSGKAGLTASLSFERSANWLLSLRSLGGDALRFVLSREIVSEDAWAAGVDLSIDASPLAGRVSAALVEATGTWGQLLDRIKPFFTPGTFARAKLGTDFDRLVGRIVSDQALRAAILSDHGLAGAAGAGEQSALLSAAEKRVAGALDAVGGRIATAAGDATTRVVDGLLRALPLVDATAAKTAVRQEVENLVGALRSAFDAEVASLAAADGKRLRKELSKVGAAVKEAADDADRATRGVRDLVERVQSLIDKATKAAGEGLARKLGARFGWQGASRTGAHYELAGEWRGDDPAFAELWRSLATGRLQPFQRLLADPAALPPGMTLDPTSSLARLAGGSRGFDLEIVAFGINVGLKQVVEAKAEIELSANGDVTVSVRGEADRAITSFRERRSAVFLTSWDIVAGRLAGDGSRTMAVSLTLEHRDKGLDPEEATSLVAGFASLGLIRQDRVARLDAEYQRWKVLAAGSGGKPRGAIVVRMTPPGGVGERMVACGRLVRDQRPGAALSLFSTAVAALMASGFVKAERKDREVEEARRQWNELRDVAEPERVVYALRGVDFAAATGSGSGNLASRFLALSRLVPRGIAFLALLEQTARIHDAEPATTSPPARGSWTEKQYEEAEKSLAKAASKWLDLNASILFGAKKAVSPSMLALFELLARLASPTLGTDAAAPGLGKWKLEDSDGWFSIAMTPDGGQAVAV